MYLETAKLCWNPATQVVQKTITSPITKKTQVSEVAICGSEQAALSFAKEYFFQSWGAGEVHLVRKKRRVCFWFKPSDASLLSSLVEKKRQQPGLR